MKEKEDAFSESGKKRVKGQFECAVFLLRFIVILESFSRSFMNFLILGRLWYDGGMEKHLSKKSREVLALLARGVALEFRRSPRGYFRTVGKDHALWGGFQRKTLLYAIRALFKNKFVVIDEQEDGHTKIALTGEGRDFFRKDKSVFSAVRGPALWDKKWRLVFFDIPEEKKNLRDALRYQLRKAGCAEFQRSAFIYPYPCFREIESLAEGLGVGEHIVLVTAETLSNEFRFKNQFGLS